VLAGTSLAGHEPEVDAACPFARQLVRRALAHRRRACDRRDRLLDAIDGVAVTDLGVDGAMARLRGSAGTRVTLTLRRDGEPLQVTVPRRRQLGWAGR